MPKRGGPRIRSGKKRIPVAYRRIEGKPEPPNDYEPVRDVGEPPAALDEAQRAKWRFAIDNSPPGLLRILDRDMLTL